VWSWRDEVYPYDEDNNFIESELNAHAIMLEMIQDLQRYEKHLHRVSVAKFALEWDMAD